MSADVTMSPEDRAKLKDAAEDMAERARQAKIAEREAASAESRPAGAGPAPTMPLGQRVEVLEKQLADWQQATRIALDLVARIGKLEARVQGASEYVQGLVDELRAKKLLAPPKKKGPTDGQVNGRTNDRGGPAAKPQGAKPRGGGDR